MYELPRTSGLLSERPAPRAVGQMYLATDKALFESLDGSTWTQVGPDSADTASIAALQSALAGKQATVPPGTYVKGDPVITVTYNSDGTVATSTEDGITTTFTYNPDGTPATSTRLGVTRTYTYAGGNLTSVA